ncbi:DUF3800 domain-containing protein [Pseudomonas sp. ADAK13]|uniref:DUF3800 domain-containing protein n=1 Tax=Pseudomonas sp. ADAK13 TaxID=2730847 RepID=UPI001463394C|nr:DUF3800 domain-containing protein [Pseudomonas sp. ADAK13]QJI36698.1 hypothetical protein HKK54_20425 [Pseudomonas sp. ADAK13]
MHIVIDDTYGPENSPQSKYVTGKRKTHVAVAFPDEEVDYVRREIKGCLDVIQQRHNIPAKEFHFVDIYNKNGPWKHLEGMKNLAIFEAFASIYKHYKWATHIQTVDDRTLADHKISGILGKVDKLDLSKRSDLSLALLLIKIKTRYPEGPLTLIMDEGKGKAGTPFGQSFFSGRTTHVIGTYQSSESEPLLQIADFLAFCINRSTYLGIKEKRTDTDNSFISLVSSMEINSIDLRIAKVNIDFSAQDVDALHYQDRIEKKLET